MMAGNNTYDIYLYDESNRKISIRVLREYVAGDVSATCKGPKWVYHVNGYEKTYSSRIEKVQDATSQSCCCCCSTSSGTGCTDCGCGAGGTSCSCANGQADCKCACCLFVKWIDTAILNVDPPGRMTASSVFFSLLPTLIYLGFFFYMGRTAMKLQGVGGAGGPGGIFKIGQSLSKTVKSNVFFSDVAGLEEEKAELVELVDYLKAPSKYKAAGARMPRGVILYGPPGTGKTLLAKAVSGEADVPFIEVAGSSFDDMYVGSGAKRIRDLFNKAKKMSPCIVFIDEIDAVAGKRGSKGLNSGGIYDQTINQLLSEMDGFNTEQGIVVMAATNRLDSIDSAVLRPGRFDRHIQVNLPNIRDRVSILKVHAKNKNISSSVDLEDVARKTPGFSGAQLENVLNEAVLLSVRFGKRVVDKSDIEEAIDRVMAGPAKKSHRMSDRERKQVAYHEAGHAIAGLYSEEGEVVEKITIIPRGQAAGYMLSAPEKQEVLIKRKEELLSAALTTLAGRASEEVFYGANKISTGAANDFYKVTKLVRSMISMFGMNEKMGLYQYEPSEESEIMLQAPFSQKSFAMIEEEAEKIIAAQYQKAKDLILSHKEELLLIVECLLLLETIDRKQIEFIHRNMKLPEEAQLMKNKLLAEGKRMDLSPSNPEVIV